MANSGITGASLSPILTRLNGVNNYHPMEANTFSDWSIEAGDLVTVVRNGQTFKSPVNTAKMTWRGSTPQVQISATGKQERDPVSILSRKKYGRGSSALLNNQEAFKSIITRYNNMVAGLELASSSAALYVLDAYNQMKSGLDLRSSSAALYVLDAYNQMKSGLDLTSSSAALYVNDMYNKMKAGLDLTMSSAMIYAENRTTRAFIMARINANGEGEASISADKVSIIADNSIKLGDVITINMSGSTQYVAIKGDNVFVGKRISHTVQMSDGMVTADTYRYRDFSDNSIKSMIKDASVSDNTLTITRFDGTTINFSKAVPSSLSGSWNSGEFPLTVTDTFDDYVIAFTESGSADMKLKLDTGSPTKLSSTTIQVPLQVQSVATGTTPPTYTTRYTETKNVVVSGLLQSKTVSASSSDDVIVSPDNAYIGLSSVTINKVKAQALKEVTPSASSAKIVSADSGYDCLQSVYVQPATEAYNQGKAAGIGGVHHIKMDYTWWSGGAHGKDWWNCYIYNSDESDSMRIQTNQSSNGVYLPIVNNHEFTANGTYYPWDFTSEGGHAGVVFGPITVSVPGGSSNPYPSQKILRCTSVASQGGSYLYTFTYTDNRLGIFSSGTQYKFHHNSGYT